jgi:hypothetical protein
MRKSGRDNEPAVERADWAVLYLQIGHGRLQIGCHGPASETAVLLRDLQFAATAKHNKKIGNLVCGKSRPVIGNRGLARLLA